MMHAETGQTFDVGEKIVAFKRQMAPRREALKRAFGEVKEHIAKAVDKIRTDNAAGRQVVPEVEYRDIHAGKVSDATREAIRRTGCAVVRGVFPGVDGERLVRRCRRSISRRTTTSSARSRSGASTSISRR